LTQLWVTPDSRGGIETPFYDYTTAAKLKPRDCHIRMHNGSELAVSSFLEWQTRMYQSAVRKSALGADQGLPSIHSESTQGSPDQEDEDGDDAEEEQSGTTIGKKTTFCLLSRRFVAK
jgi:hypothetical protein